MPIQKPIEKQFSPKIKRKQIARIEAQFLERLRVTGGMSRVELARESGLAPSTIGTYVNRLIEDGLLLEGERDTTDFGRPRLRLAVNARAGQFVGVDFDARHINAVTVDFAQQPLQQVHRTLSSSDSVDQIVDKIEDAIRAVIARQRGDVLGIAVGVPGLVDPIRGIALRYSNIDKWQNLPLARRLEERFSVPVCLEQTVAAMALAELSMGRGRDLDSFICLAVRSGIGAAIVIDRSLYRGANHIAGEIGFWQCPRFRDGRPTTVLARLQDIASAQAIVTQIEAERAQARGKGVSPGAGGAGIAEALADYQAGDRIARTVIDDAVLALGWTASQLACALNPQSIFLCGPLTALGAAVIEPIRAQIHAIPFISPDLLTEVSAGCFGDYQGAFGAAACAVNRWRPS